MPPDGKGSGGTCLFLKFTRFPRWVTSRVRLAVLRKVRCGNIKVCPLYLDIVSAQYLLSIHSGHLHELWSADNEITSIHSLKECTAHIHTDKINYWQITFMSYMYIHGNILMMSQKYRTQNGLFIPMLCRAALKRMFISVDVEELWWSVTSDSEFLFFFFFS